LAARLIAEEFRNADKPLWQGERYRHDKIRIAYLSTDFRMHAVATLIVGCLEHHDRSRFETIAVSLQPADGSALRVRMESAFDRFVHAHSMSDSAVAQLLRKLEVDIAVDLNGYTGRIRSGILAKRPAPVQVSYLGFAGTMDASFIDYILADRVVLPEENKAHYRERIACLPHTYMPSDNRRRIAEETPTRVESGLPQAGFVFACMSYAHKISPEIFDVWMRLLRSVEGSVLWLRSANAVAVTNLRHEAGIHGVSPDRLIFAPPVAGETDYLARLRVADLFLDTLPYNAHATAMDALWAGLPLLTCAGRSFQSRVAASLLYAAGLPELVTSSLAQYEEMARRFATEPARLAALRARLMRNRDTNTLFDTARMTRDLEGAYAAMWERSERGEPPMSFAVPNGLSVAAKAVS
jgi:predicted O-linked N-acetylglucosamine transferase (SPINDLY family)